VATDGKDFLVAWTDEREPSGVYAARVAAEGRVLDPVGMNLSLPYFFEQTQPAAAWLGTEFLVVSTGCDITATARLCGARVASDGRVSGRPGALVSEVLAEYSCLSLSACGNTCLAVWDRDGIRAVRVAAGGAVVDSPPILIANRQCWSASVAAGDSGWLVAWNENASDSGIFAARVGLDGKVLDSAGISITRSSHRAGDASVAFNGTNFLVVWWEQRSDGPCIRAARVTPRGEVLDSPSIPIPGSALDFEAPAVTSVGSDFLVVWSSGASIWAARVGNQGTILEPAPVALTTSDDLLVSPAVAFNGTNYLVVWSMGRGMHEICGTRVTPAGKVLDAAGIAISRPDPSRSRWR